MCGRYIEQQGGKVVAVSTLTHPRPRTGKDSTLFRITAATTAAINRKFGAGKVDAIIQSHGIAASIFQITEAEGRNLLAAESIDALRDTFIAAGYATSGETGQGSLPSSAAESQAEVTTDPSTDAGDTDTKGKDAGDGSFGAMDQLGAKLLPPSAARTTVAPIGGKTGKKIHQIVADLATALGKQVRVAKPTNAKFAGVYFPDSARTITRWHGDLSTTAHEGRKGGHSEYPCESLTRL